MSVSLLHTFVNPASDLPGFTGTKPSNWNAQHALTGTANSVLGFDGSGNALDGNLFWGAGILAGGTGAASTLTLESTSGAGALDAIFFKTASQSERMRIDTSGFITIGGSANLAVGGAKALLQTVQNNDANLDLSVFNYNNAGNGANWSTYSTRGSTPTTHVAATGGDFIHTINYLGDNGTTQVTAAAISTLVDVTATSSQMPGRFHFYTGAQGSNTLSERLRIDSLGQIIGNNPGNTGMVFGNSIFTAHSVDGTNNPYGFLSLQWSADASTPWITLGKSRGATVGTQTIVQNNDSLGTILFVGSGGDAFHEGAAIKVVVDQVPVANSRPPARITLDTVNASGTEVEGIRIDSNQLVTLGGNGANVFGGYFEVASNPTVTSHGDYIAFGANTASATHFFLKTRATTPGTQTILVSGDAIGALSFRGSDGTAFRQAATIQAICAATPATSTVPGTLQFLTTPAGSSQTPVENFRIDNTGAIYLIGVTTTGSAANAFINNASSPVNSILRSTSSLRYKADVTKVPRERIDRLMALEPIEYRSLSKADDPNRRFVGLAAEEVAEIDPELVNLDEHGHPDGVQYDRVLLLQVAALKAEIEKLKSKLS